jgi:hypothetical protein
MPKRGQHDSSPGDARQPFASVGGPDGRHAQTHDVRRERATNPTGPDRERSRRDAIVEQEMTTRQAPDTTLAIDDKHLVTLLSDLSAEDLRQTPVITPASPLRQGAAYVDLADQRRAEFRAMGADRAQPEQRLVAKDDVDHELWHRLTRNTSRAPNLRSDEARADEAG